jgi:hypothetical protein
MASQFLSCKGCSTSDPAQDTVKVDPKLLALSSFDKENTQPLQVTAKIDDKLRDHETKKPIAAPVNVKNGQRVYVLRSSGVWSQGIVADSNPAMLTLALQDGEKQIPAELIHSHIKVMTEEQQQQAEEEEREARKWQERRQEVEREAAEQELLHQEAAAATAAAAAAEEARLRQEAEEEERLCQEAEEAERAADENARNIKREAAELAAAQEKVSDWCKSNGYTDITLPKKTLRSATKFPLHTAVKHKNEEMVGLLMRCGADQRAVDSKKQSPRELAAKLNKNGSHDRILAMLR